MNNVSLIGRLTHEPELKQTDSGKFVMNFSLAVNRLKADETDFINCVVWGEYAGKMSKYLKKGQQIGVNGSLRTRTYEDKNKVKHYVTDVYVTDITLLGKKDNGAENTSENIADDVLVDFNDEGIPL